MPQSPTCTQVRIRNVRDAQTILYACYEGKLPMITARLDSADRGALESGNVYAWEERGSRSEVGIERFTEGKRWTPSRLREDFLYYYEKYLSLSENDQKLLPPPPSWDPFIKQTYSAWVTTVEGDRKWHLTAYYTDATRDELKTIDDFLILRNIVVPDGHFRSNADVKTKKDDAKTSFVSRTFAPFHPHYSMASTSEPKSYEHVSHSTSMGVFDTQGLHHASLNLKPPHIAVSGTPYPPSYIPPGADAEDIHTPDESTSGSPPSTHQSRPRRSTVTKFVLPTNTGDDPACEVIVQRPEKQGSKNSSSIALAPLHMVLRHHPYRRDPLDDKALRLLGSRA